MHAYIHIHIYIHILYIFIYNLITFKNTVNPSDRIFDTIYDSHSHAYTYIKRATNIFLHL